MESEQPNLFDAPVKEPRRKGVHKTNLQRLEEQLKDFSEYTYTATDNDLPLVFWPEESFE